MLRVNIHKRFEGFTLAATWATDARIIALVGPSGAGKTLTLQCISGLVTPDAGAIVCAGATLFDKAAGVSLRPQARRVGYVFQGYALFPHMTVLQNVSYGAGRVREGSSAHVTGNGSRALMSALGLTALASRYPSQLSGGQQQRVALARALATDPDLLLLDEPLSALDAPLRRELRAELAQTLRECGKVTVLVTHDLAEAYQIADVVVMCEDGRTTDAVPKQDLLWNPSSERVARLIGARNILSGRIAAVGDDSIALDWRGRRLQAARSPSHALAAGVGDTLSFFVRPEYLRLIRKDRGVPDPARHINLLQGRIVADRDEGTTWVLLFKLDAAGDPSQGTHDLEIEVPKLVYERLNVASDRQWDVSVHPGSIQVLPSQ
jgi:molybdate transport system ATP-binding protein